MKVGRREFLRTAAYTAAALSAVNDVEAQGGVPDFKTPYRHSLQRHFGKYTHDDADWYRLRDGLEFSRIRVYNDGKPVDSLAVVRADPERNGFRVFHDGTKLKNVEKWQDITGADVMFNSSYYGYNMSSAYQMKSVDPVTLIITDGQMKGPRVNRQVQGMFVAEPRVSSVKHAKIIDMSREHYDYRRNEWNTGVQSWPLLVNEDGKIGTGPSNWYANRTAICDDTNGNILAVTTEGGFFSLYELGKFLRQSKLDIKNALNMDGGYEADMCIRTPKLNYVTYGQWETQGSRDISMPGGHIVLPAVVGIFPRS